MRLSDVYVLSKYRRLLSDPCAVRILELFFLSFRFSDSGLFRTTRPVAHRLPKDGNADFECTNRAMAPAAVLILALIIYTGFTVPIRDMHPWFRWINYLDPVAYAFEALLINEFHNRRFECSAFVPSYANVTPDQHICSAVGAAPGATYVEGDAYINASFKYYRSHLWRNLGILIGITIALCAVYLTATEYISAQRSKGEGNKTLNFYRF